MRTHSFFIRQWIKKGVQYTLAWLIAVFLAGCSGESKPDPSAPPSVSLRPNAAIMMPEEGNSDITENDVCSIDASHKESGYVLVRCATGKDKRLKVQIQIQEQIYNYDLPNDDSVTCFPLSEGDGNYRITVFENIADNRYSPLLSKQIAVTLKDEYAPFVLPNQFVDYSPESQAVQKGLSLTKDAKDDLAVVNDVFNFIIKNIAYDDEKAENPPAGYLPSVDETLRTQKGICFDYAALMATMLRSQGIPTKLVVGYVEPLDIYHAWNMVYITDVGWVNTMIYFDGENWQLADPTFAAGGSSSEDFSYHPVYTY